MLEIATCPVVIDILDKRDIATAGVVGDGKKMAGDAAYGLAAQLLAYDLNRNAGAGSCSEADAAAISGHVLPLDINFDGTGSYLKGNNKTVQQTRQDATMYAGILDSYNNNTLCATP